MPPGMVQRSLPHKLILTAAVLVYGAGAFCVLAQLFPRVSLFEMAVSFLPLISLAGVAVTLALFRYQPRASLAGLAYMVWVALPFISFSKYAAPTGTDCEPGDCLTVIVANVFKSEDALVRLADLTIQNDADLIALLEPPLSANEASYRRLFPVHGHMVHVDRSPQASSPLSLISRLPLASSRSEIPNRTGFRSYIQADLTGRWEGIRLVTTHPHIPLTVPGLSTRNTLLKAAGDAADARYSFILMGDFNLTPWSSTFRALPGKRAGDPRFVRTWPVAWGPLGIPIDHIMFSEDLELVETRLLPRTGSDHRAILVKFRREAPE